MFNGFKTDGSNFFGVPNNNFSGFERSLQEPLLSLFGSLSGSNKWIGGVLAPNGKIYGIPYNSTQILEIDPVTQTTALFGSLSGLNKWTGGVLAPNGKIYGIPRDSTQILEIEPSTGLVTNEMINIPSPISGLATSEYNQHQNKF